MTNELFEVLNLTLFEAGELQRAARKYRSRKLTRERFIGAVEELSSKMEQRMRPIWEKAGRRL